MSVKVKSKLFEICVPESLNFDTKITVLYDTDLGMRKSIFVVILKMVANKDQDKI